MPQVCLYLQLHQPYRLKDFSVFEVGQRISYFESKGVASNKKIFQKVAKKSYLPMLKLLLKLVKKFPDFKFSLSMSGVWLDQAEAYQPQVVILLQQLLKTGQVEILAETYFHSLASLYSPKEFRHQVAAHTARMAEVFGVKPKVFRNTELIYSNEIAALITDMKFTGMLTDAVPRYLKGKDLTQVFRSKSKKSLPLLLKHAQLSDDLAFRFSDKLWQWYPLSVDRYLKWISNYKSDQLVNLFMDFETFGEHQWKETGIFTFFANFVKEFSRQKGNTFVTPSHVFARYKGKSKKLPIYDVKEPISWADVDRDLTAWIENPFQQDALHKLYGLEAKILASKNPELIADWRRLQTSDHFYYMCTKWSADGDVHAYFSPYKTPHEAYRRYSIVLADLMERLL